MTTPVEEVKPVENTVAESVTTNQSVPENKEPSEDQINWKLFREKREQERKEREEYARRLKQKEDEANALKEALEAVISKAAPVNSQRDEESEEDRIARLVRETVEKETARKEQERLAKEAQEFPKKLRKEHVDFDKVVTEENLDYLEYHYPEIAATYKELPDGYNKWANLYKTVKKLIPNPASTSDQKKIEKNLARPPSLSSPAVAAPEVTGPRVLTDAMKAANWERMQRALKGAE